MAKKRSTYVSKRSSKSYKPKTTARSKKSSTTKTVIIKV